MYLIVKFISLDILYRGMTGIVVLGGTLDYIRDGLPYCVRSELQAPNVESCVVEINRVKARKLFIFTLYKASDKKLEHFIESLSNVLRTVPTGHGS